MGCDFSQATGEVVLLARILLQLQEYVKRLINRFKTVYRNTSKTARKQRALDHEPRSDLNLKYTYCGCHAPTSEACQSCGPSRPGWRNTTYTARAYRTRTACPPRACRRRSSERRGRIPSGAPRRGRRSWRSSRCSLRRTGRAERGAAPRSRATHRTSARTRRRSRGASRPL